MSDQGVPQEGPAESAGGEGQVADSPMIAPETVVQGQEDEGPGSAPRQTAPDDQAAAAQERQDRLADIQRNLAKAEQTLFATTRDDPEYGSRAEAVTNLREELRSASRG